MSNALQWLRKNRTLAIILTILLVLFIMAIRGMSTKDWVITALRGLAVGAVTFLVASGFSLIFGLMDVLNLAHGTMFMIGAYVGWTVYVRPDTFLDILTPAALVIGGLLLRPVWGYLLRRVNVGDKVARVWPWVALVIALVLLVVIFPRYPIASWDAGDYSASPIGYATQMGQGTLVVPDAGEFEGLPAGVGLIGMLLAGCSLAAGLAGFAHRRMATVAANVPLPWRAMIIAVVVVGIGIAVFVANDSLTEFLLDLSTTWLFAIAVVVATLSGAALGALTESTLVRPLYARPTYQILLTLGVSFMGLEIVRAIWGRPEFIMPKPALFTGTGEGCPATSLRDWMTYKCSTIFLLGSRVRVYNEIFVIIAGLVVLVAVWLLLKRTRLGMIIRAGVQDSEMVQALGINVRSVFTLVFALGVGLAAFGGVLAGPSMGLSTHMGQSALLNTLVALAIGGLTSYPGAAAGSLLVGLLQQFIIKYGAIGINLPFLAEPFKPTPPLVPASTVLLMVIILLVMPNGLFGRKE
jgi:branched-chain amino acid transport system permease protein